MFAFRGRAVRCARCSCPCAGGSSGHSNDGSGSGAGRSGGGASVRQRAPWAGQEEKLSGRGGEGLQRVAPSTACALALGAWSSPLPVGDGCSRAQPRLHTAGLLATLASGFGSCAPRCFVVHGVVAGRHATWARRPVSGAVHCGAAASAFRLLQKMRFGAKSLIPPTVQCGE